MIPLQSVRDGIDIVTIEKISVIGILLLVIFLLLYSVWSLQKSMKELRTQHKKEIDNLTARHEAKLEEMNKAMIRQLIESGEAYKQQSETLRLIMQSQNTK